MTWEASQWQIRCRNPFLLGSNCTLMQILIDLNERDLNLAIAPYIRYRILIITFQASHRRQALTLSEWTEPLSSAGGNAFRQCCRWNWFVATQWWAIPTLNTPGCLATLTTDKWCMRTDGSWNPSKLNQNWACSSSWTELDSIESNHIANDTHPWSTEGHESDSISSRCRNHERFRNDVISLMLQSDVSLCI